MQVRRRASAPLVMVLLAIVAAVMLWPMYFPAPMPGEADMGIVKITLDAAAGNGRAELPKRMEKYEPDEAAAAELQDILSKYTYHRAFHLGSSLGTPKDGYTLTMTYWDEDGAPVYLSWGGSGLVFVNDTIYQIGMGSKPCRAMMAEISEVLDGLEPVSDSETE